MWLLSPVRGFVSAVQHRDYPDVIIVRARARADLEACLELIAAELAEVIVDLKPDEDADYRWRFELGRGEFVRMVAALAEEVSWTNVKTAAFEARKFRLETAMHHVWWDLLDLDDRPGGKWGGYRRAEDPDAWIAEDEEELRRQEEELRGLEDVSVGFSGRKKSAKKKSRKTPKGRGS